MNPGQRVGDHGSFISSCHSASGNAASDSPSKIGNKVVFTPVTAGAPPISGVIINEVWSPACYGPAWDWHAYTSQLIKWDNTEEKSVRITYYYQPLGSSTWLFGGQHSIEDFPDKVTEHLNRSLAKG